MSLSPVVSKSCYSSWYIVFTSTGVAAVVYSEDLIEIITGEQISLAIRVTFEEGVQFERTRAGYMSATCRLKSGESDRVG